MEVECDRSHFSSKGKEKGGYVVHRVIKLPQFLETTKKNSQKPKIIFVSFLSNKFLVKCQGKSNTIEYTVQLLRNEAYYIDLRKIAKD